jgi:selenocysteine lyase/cysteine desulfurase
MRLLSDSLETGTGSSNSLRSAKQNTGAVDPIAQMVAIARRRGISLHVDGAYGLFGKLDSCVAPLFDGVEEADSVAMDPHKWLAAPSGSGAVFVRDRALQERAFTMKPADYAEGAMVRGEVNSTFDYLGDDYLQIGPEMSAQSRGVAIVVRVLDLEPGVSFGNVQRPYRGVVGLNIYSCA